MTSAYNFVMPLVFLLLNDIFIDNISYD